MERNRKPDTLRVLSVTKNSAAHSLTDLVHLRWKATKRPRDYEIAFTHWCEFLQTKHQTLDINQLLLSATQHDALAFCDKLQEAGYAKNSRVKYVRIARQIYDIAQKGGFRADNPFVLVRLPKQTRERPLRLIPFEAVNVLLDAPSANTRKGREARAIFGLLFGCALRRSEVVALRGIDICHAQDGTPYLILRDPKAGKVQQQAVPDWAMERLYATLRDRYEDGAGPKARIFEMTDQTLQRIFSRYCRAIGLPGHFTPHAARATAITKLLSDGVPLRDVQQFARHSHSWITEMYDGRAFAVEHSPGKRLKF